MITKPLKIYSEFKSIEYQMWGKGLSRQDMLKVIWGCKADVASILLDKN